MLSLLDISCFLYLNTFNKPQSFRAKESLNACNCISVESIIAQPVELAAAATAADWRPTGVQGDLMIYLIIIAATTCRQLRSQSAGSCQSRSFSPEALLNAMVAK